MIKKQLIICTLNLKIIQQKFNKIAGNGNQLTLAQLSLMSPLQRQFIIFLMEHYFINKHVYDSADVIKLSFTFQNGESPHTITFNLNPFAP